MKNEDITVLFHLHSACTKSHHLEKEADLLLLLHELPERQ